MKPHGPSLFRLLKGKNEYVFSVVSFNGGTEELLDEQLSLFDVKPVKPYLKVVKRQGNEAAKLLESKISILIGRSITPVSKYEEVDDMRQTFIPFCEKLSHQRSSLSWEHRAIYAYPPELADGDELPEKLQKKLESIENRVRVSVSMMSANSSLKNIIKTFEITNEVFPQNLIDLALRKRSPNIKSTTCGKQRRLCVKNLWEIYIFSRSIRIN